MSSAVYTCCSGIFTNNISFKWHYKFILTQIRGNNKIMKAKALPITCIFSKVPPSRVKSGVNVLPRHKWNLVALHWVTFVSCSSQRMLLKRARWVYFPSAFLFLNVYDSDKKVACKKLVGKRVMGSFNFFVKSIIRMEYSHLDTVTLNCCIDLKTCYFCSGGIVACRSKCYRKGQVDFILLYIIFWDHRTKLVVIFASNLDWGMPFWNIVWAETKFWWIMFKKNGKIPLTKGRKRLFMPKYEPFIAIVVYQVWTKNVIYSVDSKKIKYLSL